MSQATENAYKTAIVCWGDVYRNSGKSTKGGHPGMIGMSGQPDGWDQETVEIESAIFTLIQAYEAKRTPLRAECMKATWKRVFGELYK